MLQRKKKQNIKWWKKLERRKLLTFNIRQKHSFYFMLKNKRKEEEEEEKLFYLKKKPRILIFWNLWIFFLESVLRCLKTMLNSHKRKRRIDTFFPQTITKKSTLKGPCHPKTIRKRRTKSYLRLFFRFQRCSFEDFLIMFHANINTHIYYNHPPLSLPPYKKKKHK